MNDLTKDIERVMPTEEDIKNYRIAVDWFSKLSDDDYDGAYSLHKFALAQYERWSYILYTIKVAETKENKNPALKERIDHCLRILNNIYTSSRVVYGKAKKDLNI
ncbi:MAG: hypothetical protein RR460_08705 [Clostridium sp.]